VAVAAALWVQGRNRADATVLAALPSGWRNARLPAQRTAFTLGDREVEVVYRSRRDGSFQVGADSTARVLAWSPDAIDVEVDGRRSTSRITRVGDVLHVQGLRTTLDLHLVPRFASPETAGALGGLVAPMPGVAIDVRVAAGDTVVAGQVLVVLEAMKMEHHVSAPDDGVVTDVHVRTGDQVPNGAVLLVIEPLDDAEAAS
jgi:propionyl-CoA carboxylase alpha chain